jgi:hypothetical protein
MDVSSCGSQKSPQNIREAWSFSSSCIMVVKCAMPNIKKMVDYVSVIIAVSFL